MVEIAHGVRVPQSAVSLKFVRASGPGGQNVNKVATAVELRLDLGQSELPEGLCARLRRAAGRRLTAAGEIVIFAQTHRSQARNREESFARLARLVTRASHVPKKRVPTKPSRSAKQRRREFKRRRGGVKRGRARPDVDG